MEYRVFDPLLDPVIIINSDGDIRHINPITSRWLASVDDFGIVGSNISKFLTFSESPALTTMVSLVEFQNTGYHLTHFKLLARNYQSTAKICVVRLANENNQSMFGIIIRDREFIKTILDDDDAKLKKSLDQTDKQSFVSSPSIKGLAAQTPAPQDVLSEESIVKAIPKDRQAKFECIVNLVFVDIAKAAAGNAMIISDHWMEVLIRPQPQIKPGMKINMEVAGNIKMRGFSSVGKLMDIISQNSEDQLIRIELGNLSTLSRRALDEYLEVNAIKI